MLVGIYPSDVLRRLCFLFSCWGRGPWRNPGINIIHAILAIIPMLVGIYPSDVLRRMCFLFSCLVWIFPEIPVHRNGIACGVCSSTWSSCWCHRCWSWCSLLSCFSSLFCSFALQGVPQMGWTVFLLHGKKTCTSMLMGCLCSGLLQLCCLHSKKHRCQ